MQRVEIARAARSLVFHLQEHFRMDGADLPPSGEPTIKSFAPVVSAIQRLSLLLPAGSTSDQSDAVDRIVESRDAIARHFGLDPSAERGDEISLDVGQIELLDPSLVNMLEWSAEQLQKEVKAPGDGSGKRPAYHRDRKWLEWYEASGSETYRSYAKIRDKWNSLSPEQREEISPDFSSGIPKRGRTGADRVEKGIEKATNDRESEQKL